MRSLHYLLFIEFLLLIPSYQSPPNRSSVIQLNDHNESDLIPTIDSKAVDLSVASSARISIKNDSEATESVSKFWTSLKRFSNDYHDGNSKYFVGCESSKALELHKIKCCVVRTTNRSFFQRFIQWSKN